MFNQYKKRLPKGQPFKSNFMIVSANLLIKQLRFNKFNNLYVSISRFYSQEVNTWHQSFR
jgi:hypothetical protein